MMTITIFKIELPRKKQGFYLTPREYDRIKPYLNRLRELARDSRDLAKTYKLYQKHGWLEAAEKVLQKVKVNLEEEKQIETIIIRIIEKGRDSDR
jgi:hypothetical protein